MLARRSQPVHKNRWPLIGYPVDELPAHVRRVDYTTTPFEQIAREVDLGLDTIGGETLRRSMGVVSRGGRLVSLLEEPAQDKAREQGIYARKNAVTPTNEHLRSIAQLIEEGQVKSTSARVFALHEARQAHELSQTGHGRGRIVLHLAG